MKTQNKFQQFLSDTLTVSRMEQLPELMGISKKKLTRLLSGYDEWDYTMLRRFIDLFTDWFVCLPGTGTDPRTPFDFIKDYGMKTSLRFTDVERLNEWYEAKMAAFAKAEKEKKDDFLNQ
jgi:hypothetical protein